MAAADPTPTPRGTVAPGPWPTLGVLAGWATLKLVAINAWVVQVGQYSDTYYYSTATRRALADGSVAGVLGEYPTPAAWFLLLPRVLGGDTDQGYRAAFLLLLAVVDLAFLLLVLGRLGATAAWAWVVLGAASGQMALLRMDLLPAVLAGAALLFLLQGRAPTAAVFVTLGTAAKVWPILLAPLLLGGRGRPPRIRALGALAASGVVVALLSVAGAGWARLWTPLDYQADRGLQIEAVAATPAMLRWASEPGFAVHYSTFKAYEVTGPGVDALLQASTLAAWLALGLGVVLLAWWWWRGCPVGATGHLALLLVTLFVATSKVFSPQYLLWLATLAVVVFGCSWVDPDAHPRARATVVLGLVAATVVLTTTIYPTHYTGLLARTEQTRIALDLLVLRNGLVVLLVGVLVGFVVATLLRPGPAPRVGPTPPRGNTTQPPAGPDPRR